MASSKLIAAAAGPDEDLKMDMSPMIDLVFLLLIFFMVNSTLIVVRIDQNEVTIEHNDKLGAYYINNLYANKSDAT